MKHSHLLLGILILTLAGSYWAVKGKMPTVGKEDLVNFDPTLQTNALAQKKPAPYPRPEPLLRRGAAPLTNIGGNRRPSSESFPISQELPGEAKAYNLNDSLERQEFAEVMRRRGFSDQEARDILERQETATPPGEDVTVPEADPYASSGGKAKAYNLNDSLERKEFAEVMRRRGFPDQEARDILERQETAAPPGNEDVTVPEAGPSASSGREAKAYNLNDPVDKALWDAAMIDAGLEEDGVRGMQEEEVPGMPNNLPEPGN